MKKTVVITGASGLLGQYMSQYFSKDYDVIALYLSNSPQNIKLNNSISLVQIDLTDAGAVTSLLQSQNPDFVIHTAGLTSVDQCESNPKLAEMLNVQTTANLTDNLDTHKTKFIHISTDHLFSGNEKFQEETSAAQPLNEYARTKYLAEQIVHKFKNSLIIRTNFYGGTTAYKKSFSNWIYNELNSGRSIHAFDNSFFTPISIPTLTENIENLMCSQLSGTYNVVGNDRLSKFEFAQQLAEIFNLDSTLIIRSNIEEAHLKAPRPHDMSLSNAKIKKDLTTFKGESLYEGLKKIRLHNLI